MNLLPVYRKTRIAPTPSGYLHLGNLLSFTITAGLAKKHQASILLRIDDLDQARVRKEYVEDIFDTLQFMGIPWDEGPRHYDEYVSTWSQVHRVPIYEQNLQHLRSAQQVFACDCPRSVNYPGECAEKMLSLDSNDHCWRIRTDQPVFANIADYTGNKTNISLPASMRHFVVRKKDGVAAYQLSSIVDDSHFGVDLVVRGIDLWDSTVAQVFLGRLLPGNRFPETVFYHHALLAGADGQKLSKTTDAPSIRYLRAKGICPAGIYSQLAGLLGFKESPGNWEQLFALVDP